MRCTCLLILAMVLMLAGCDRGDSANGDSTRPLVLGVNDVFCERTFSGCVKDAQPRNYDGLAKALSERIGQPVELKYLGTDELVVQAAKAGEIDGVICKTWTAMRAAEASGRELFRLADLSMPDGPDQLEGVFFVRADSPIKAPADLAGRTLAIGSEASYEKAQAARARLAEWGVMPSELREIQTCLSTTLAVFEGKVDAGVQSSYAWHFGTLEQVAPRDQFREIGRSGPVPFMSIAVFAASGMPPADRLRQAVDELAESPPADLGKTRIMPPAAWPR